MPKEEQLFPFDPIPHARNKLQDVFGTRVLGRWVTTEGGKKVCRSERRVFVASNTFACLCRGTKIGGLDGCQLVPYQIKLNIRRATVCVHLLPCLRCETLGGCAPLLMCLLRK